MPNTGYLSIFRMRSVQQVANPLYKTSPFLLTTYCFSVHYKQFFFNFGVLTTPKIKEDEYPPGALTAITRLDGAAQLQRCHCISLPLRRCGIFTG